MSDLLTLILAIIGATGASVVTTLATRPKTRAEAAATTAGGEVSVSADAREWARDFAKRADAAEQRAAAAEVRAAAAEEKVADCEARCDDVEHRFELLIDHARLLQLNVLVAGGTLPPPPAELLEDLGPPPAPQSTP